MAWALLNNDGVIKNIILWDGITDLGELQPVEVPDHSAIGWRQAGNDWVIEPAIVDNATQREKRAEAFRNEADPLYFKSLRGEATEQQWRDLVADIRNRYPYAEIEPVAFPLPSGD